MPGGEYGFHDACGHDFHACDHEPRLHSDLSRRKLMAVAAGAVGASGLSGITGASAAASRTIPVAERRIIDVHHHVVPPEYLAMTRAAQQGPVINWSPQKSLDDMDKAGVATSMASITAPGVWFGDNVISAKLSRISNDYMAKLVSDHPGRFGIFAALPLPDVEASLKEIDYAFGTLKADGIGLMTSYGDKWLGDPLFDPVMAELNRRKAVVYTHPNIAYCCGGLIPGTNILPTIPFSMIEFGTDTTRAIASILFRGQAKKYPEIQWIFSHCGGTMPFLIERFIRATPDLKANLPNPDVIASLKRFHYDVAQATNAIPLDAIIKIVSVSQMMFGTDFPFRTSDEHVQGLFNFGFSDGDLKAIFRDNAVKLLPKYKA